jgi:hypothetical protein
MNGKALCVIYSESIAVLKKYSIARHCNSKHKEKYRTCIGASRRELATLKSGFEAQQNGFR